MAGSARPTDGASSLLGIYLNDHLAGADAVDLDQLIVRAERQLADVEAHRLGAGIALRRGTATASPAGETPSRA